MYLFFFVQAGKAGNLSSAVNLRVSVAALEAFLPQYQLGGEWEGIYASHGKETVSIRCEIYNVGVCVCARAHVSIRYEGSTRVAAKMTGDNHVPKGEGPHLMYLLFLFLFSGTRARRWWR